MFFRSTTSGYAFLIDVGSGSIGLAVCSGAEQSDLIWSHREYTPLKQIKSVNESSKALLTAIMSAMLVFESEGRPALLQHDKSAKITAMQATVAAPWAYTVARTVKFDTDERFTITEEMLSNLATTAADQAMEEFSAEHSLESLGVQETSRTILDPHANGYRITEINQQQATQLSVTHVSTLVRTEIIASLTEMQQKLFARVPLETTSFMMANYYVTDALQPVGVDFCLVDITNEATELGIIRHNALQYSTHVAFGRASIAREISAATKVPLHDAFTSIRSLHQETKLHKDIDETLKVYQEKLVDLFKETGDRLTIPKHIYLQVDAGLADFFTPIVEAAGKKASKGNVLVTPLSQNLINTRAETKQSVDIALLVARSFFHTKEDRAFFKYL